MYQPPSTTRRSVLATAGIGLAGSVATAGWQRDRGTGRGARAKPDLEIAATHDHDAHEHEFRLSTAEVPAGWTTIRLDNRSHVAHFAYLAKVPQAALDGAQEDGVDVLDYYTEHVTRPFQWFMDDINPAADPNDDDLSAKYTTEEAIFPPWFGDVQPSGGVGFTAPGSSSTTTVHLDPGQYIVECYVKDAEGRFHSYLGMIELLTVTEDDGAAGPPEPTLDVAVSTDGIDARDAVRPGRHTVAVRFEDQAVYEHLLGHDVHLVELDGATEPNDFDAWTNWMNPGGLVSTEENPGPGTFRGGVQTILTPELLGEDPTPAVAYLHMTLKPGEYAWFSEIPEPSTTGHLSVFAVPGADTGGGRPAASGRSR